MTKFKYFGRFNSQGQFHSTELPEWFFKIWTDPNTKLLWHQYASSSIKHLVEHKDAPLWLREQYKSAPQVEKRMAALIINAPKEYAFANIHRISQDRSKVLKKKFVTNFLMPKLLGASTPFDLCTKLYLHLENKPLFIDELRFKDETYRRSNEYMNNYDCPVVDPSNFVPLSEEELKIIKSTSTDYQYNIVKEISDFAGNHTLGLISTSKRVRRFAEEYFELRRK